MTAGAPAGGPTGIGDKDFEDLGEFEVSASGTTFKVSGTAFYVPDWTEFSANEVDRTGYYIPLVLSGDEGAYFGKTMATNEWKVIPLSECDAAHGGLVISVKKGQKSFTFQAFAGEEDATAKRNGTAYTVDLSGVSYAE